MAVTRAGSVILMAADNDTITGSFKICGIKYIAGTGSPTAQLKAESTSGMVLWETALTTPIFEDIEMYYSGTIHADLAGTGTLVYIYLE